MKDWDIKFLKKKQYLRNCNLYIWKSVRKLWFFLIERIMKMYISDYCEVNYEEKYNVVLVKWKKFCCNQDYRKPLEYALDIIKQHENCDYVADTRSGFENIPEDTQWVADYFMPMAVEYGCKCIYFIIDKSNSLKEELEGQENDSSDKIEFKYIYSLEEVEI